MSLWWKAAERTERQTRRATQAKPRQRQALMLKTQMCLLQLLQQWICFTEVRIKFIPSLSGGGAPAPGKPRRLGRSLPNFCLRPHLSVCHPLSFTSLSHSLVSIQGSVSHYKQHAAVLRSPPSRVADTTMVNCLALMMALSSALKWKYCWHNYVHHQRSYWHMDLSLSPASAAPWALCNGLSTTPTWSLLKGGFVSHINKSMSNKEMEKLHMEDG